MALNFPDSPSNGDQTTLGGLSFTYNSTKTVWEVSAGSTVAPAIVDSSGTPTLATGITEAEIKTLLNISSGATTYATVSALPTSGVTDGTQAFVTANSRLYIYNGSGWYSVALLNTSPTYLSLIHI